MVEIDWRPFEQVAFSLYFNAFRLDGDVKKSGGSGSVVYEMKRPGLAMKYT